MPWKEVSKMSQKREFLKQAEKRVISFKELCQRFNISRPTGYKWVKRYVEQGENGLKERSRKPLNKNNKTREDIENMIIKIKQKHPAWGGRKIRTILQREGVSPVPAKSTVSDILKRKGLVNTPCKESQSLQRFEHEHPNDLWQIDFKGHFAIAEGRCHPLSILDDHSRYLVGLKACKHQQKETVWQHLTAIFRKYGLPKRINFDNGQPWGSIFSNACYTTLGLWIIEQGVEVSYSRPRRPQTNGKVERFHRTLGQELLEVKYYQNLREAQKSFDDWRRLYNDYRPHEALDMSTPSERYRISHRTFKETVAEYEHSADHIMFRVDSRGSINLKGSRYFIGMPFAAKDVALRPTLEDGIYDIYYRHQKLKVLDLNKNELISRYKWKRDKFVNDVSGRL